MHNSITSNQLRDRYDISAEVPDSQLNRAISDAIEFDIADNPITGGARFEIGLLELSYAHFLMAGGAKNTAAGRVIASLGGGTQENKQTTGRVALLHRQRGLRMIFGVCKKFKIIGNDNNK